MADALRPTKKQREILTFIEGFIGEHGYSPSYREIMTGLSYNSVATVALHVNSLISRGHLRKRDHSARSIEVVAQVASNGPITDVKPGEEKWLIDKVNHLFTEAEQSDVSQQQLDELYVLIGALKVLGFDAAAHSFIPRLKEIKVAGAEA